MHKSLHGVASREPCPPSQRLGKSRAGERGSRCTKDEASVCLYVFIQCSEFRRDEKMCKKVLHVTWFPPDRSPIYSITGREEEGRPRNLTSPKLSGFLHQLPKVFPGYIL